MHARRTGDLGPGFDARTQDSGPMEEGPCSVHAGIKVRRVALILATPGQQRLQRFRISVVELCKRQQMPARCKSLGAAHCPLHFLHCQLSLCGTPSREDDSQA